MPSELESAVVNRIVKSKTGIDLDKVKSGSDGNKSDKIDSSDDKKGHSAKSAKQNDTHDKDSESDNNSDKHKKDSDSEKSSKKKDKSEREFSSDKSEQEKADKKNKSEDDKKDKLESKSDSDEEHSEGGGKKKKKSNPLKKAQMATGAAQGAMKMISLAKFAEMLKVMMLYAMQIASNIASFAASAVQAVIAMVVHAVATVAAALAVSVAVAAVGVFGIVAAVVVGAVIIVSSVVANNTAARDDYTNPCDVQYIEYDEMVLDADETETAMKIWSALSSYGMSDVNIAGVLGNWSHESGIDSTSVETVLNERYAIGPIKSEAQLDWDYFTKNVVFPAYTISINEDAYRATDSYYYPGIGLGQWTGERARMLLAFADSAGDGYEWYALETQLAFMIGADSRKDWIRKWTVESTPEQAAKNFMEGWEGINNSTLSSRQTSAALYFIQMAEWTVDADYGESIIDLAGTTALDGDARAAVQSYGDCGVRSYNNSSIAKAAISFAWDSRELAMNNNGTSLYQLVANECNVGHPYQECAAVVASAVRWSGADDDYPAHAVAAQLEYVESSSQWIEIPWDASANQISNLKPGDIFIIQDGASHTFVYCGEKLVDEVRDWKDTPMDTVAGSFSEDGVDGRSAGLEDHFKKSNGGQSMPQAAYRVFRNVQKETNSIYMDVASDYVTK